MMNIFRLAGDMSHLLAIMILLFKILKTGSCKGISGKSQILFCIVYCTRYLDLFTNYIMDLEYYNPLDIFIDYVSEYNSVMKMIFIAASTVTIYLIYVKFRATNDTNQDSFRIEFLVFPCAVLALVINHDFTCEEILWTFSIYLESVAILPQFYLISKTGKAESMISLYLFALGSYRAFYMVNWGFRYVYEMHYDLIAICAGTVQTLLYCIFFYLYITKFSKSNNLANNLIISTLPLSSDDNSKEKEALHTNIYI